MIELRETNRAILEAPVGAKLRCIKSFTHSSGIGQRWSNVTRLSEGTIYTKAATGTAVWDDLNEQSIAIEKCDAGHLCYWPSPDEYFEIVT